MSKLARSFAKRIVISIIGSVCATGVLAQTPPERGVIDGVVTDTNLVALDSVTISIAGTPLKVITGGGGRFRIRDLLAGEYVLVVERAGFAPSSNKVQVIAQDTLRVSFTLQPGTSRAISASVPANSDALTDFEVRRRRGVGQFMTRDDIQRQNAKSIADLLRRFNGISTLGAAVVRPADSRTVVSNQYVAVGPRGVCKLQVYLDGIPVPDGLDRFPPPASLAAIELYARSEMVPVQYQSGTGDYCGALLAWTLRP